ncbi:RagB/SusD family nutrient uptake outer membrane protein [termite gut metagenome]|uniref:RagB/SusD family nutrient uptake outer membrane protein n=1 Tax=termite gut metagenome TaxID=433724 RepID=A0A5J4RI39_9ZZZZ
MKKSIFLAVLGLSFALYSCNDDDDDINDDDIITTEIVKTNAEAEALGNAVYGPLQRLSSSFSFLIELATESTISFEAADDNGGPIISRLEHGATTGVVTAHDYPDKVFSRLYESIGSSNIAIEKLDSSKVTTKLSQETKKLVKARVKFTRALSYHYLVQLYGEVPLKLQQTDANVTTRASIDEVYAQIVRDLTEAEADLPLYDSNKANPSKGAANAILARVYLAWASNPLTQAQLEAIKASQTDPAAPTWNTERLQKAVDYANKVIDSEQYSLLADYNRNFGVAGENGVEHIYTIHHEGDGVDAQGNHQTHCPFTNRFTNLTADFHIGPADATLLNRFDSNDKRKLLTYTTRLFNTDERNQEYKWEFPVTTPIYGKWIHRSGYATTGTSPTIERAGGSSAAQPNNINRIEIRYAEVLLIKAEALFFQNKAAEALPLINQLRERAFGEHFEHDNKLTTLTKENLFREWDLELNFEQKHWTNLVRWRTLVSTVKTVANFEYYKPAYNTTDGVIAKAKELNPSIQNGDVNAAFFVKINKHLHAKYDNVKGKHYRFPIPQLSGIDQGVTPQNPGY